jgi:hypothetical protein
VRDFISRQGGRAEHGQATMREFFERYRNESVGVVGVRGGRVLDAEIRDVSDQFVTLFNAAEGTNLHIPYGSVRIVMDNSAGVPWPRFGLRQRKFRLIVRLDVNVTVLA